MKICAVLVANQNQNTKGKMKSNTTESETAAPHDIAAENEKLKSELASTQKQLQQLGVVADELRPMVEAKMRAGLSKDDAVQAARRQHAHDKIIAESLKLKSEIPITDKESLREHNQDTQSIRNRYVQERAVTAGSL